MVRWVGGGREVEHFIHSHPLGAELMRVLQYHLLIRLIN